MLHLPSTALRPFRKTDTDFFAGMASDEQVTRFVGDGRPWDEQTIQVRVHAALQQDPLNNIGASRWFLATEAHEPVGIVVSTRKEDGIEIGYWVSPNCWGRGIAGAIVESALETIPEVYGTRKLIARVDPENIASAKLLTRRGFKLETRDEGLDRYTRV